MRISSFFLLQSFFAMAIGITSCRKTAALVPADDALEVATDVADASLANGNGAYEHVLLDDMGQMGRDYDGKRIEFDEIFDAPPNHQLAPPEVCGSPFAPATRVAPSFPNMESQEAPRCFRLVVGHIDPASVIPNAQMRARVRGVYHVFSPDAAPYNIERTSLALDAFEPLPDPDYEEMTVADILARGTALQERRVSVKGEAWASFRAPDRIYDFSPPDVDAGLLEGPTVCLAIAAPQTNKIRLLQLAGTPMHFRGRVVSRHRTDGCLAMLFVDSGEKTRVERRDAAP